MTSIVVEYLSSLDPPKVIGVVIALVLLWVFRAPLDALRNRKTSQEKAVVAQAQVVVAEADFEVAEYRRADSLVRRYLARAERAEKSRDEALDLVRKARDDVHEVRNAAMVEMTATRKSAETEIHRIEHAAAARIAAAEAEVTDAVRRIEELIDQVRERDQRIATLTAQHEQCISRNDELNAMLHRRMDAAGFDPTTTRS